MDGQEEYARAMRLKFCAKEMIVLDDGSLQQEYVDTGLLVFLEGEISCFDLLKLVNTRQIFSKAASWHVEME